MAKEVCISVQALYDEFGENLCYGGIVWDYDTDSKSDYYNLYDGFGNMVCMDGEMCEIVNDNTDNGDVVLVNREGETDTEFTLSAEEFKIATFKEIR